MHNFPASFSKMFYLCIFGLLFSLCHWTDLANARKLTVEKRYDRADIESDDSVNGDLSHAQIVSQDPWSVTDSNINSAKLQDPSDQRDPESDLIDVENSEQMIEMPAFDWNAKDVLSDDKRNTKKTNPTSKSSTNPCGTDVHQSHIYVSCGGPAGGLLKTPYFVANCVNGKSFSLPPQFQSDTT